MAKHPQKDNRFHPVKGDNSQTANVQTAGKPTPIPPNDSTTPVVPTLTPQADDS